MGAGDKQTGIILPALAIPEGQATDIELTFVAASNIGGDGTGKPDAVTVTVAILEGPGSINGDQGKESEPMTPGEHWEWTPMSVKLYGITGETRVVIRSTLQGLSGYYRWYLDNVKMTREFQLAVSRGIDRVTSVDARGRTRRRADHHHGGTDQRLAGRVGHLAAHLIAALRL